MTTAQLTCRYPAAFSLGAWYKTWYCGFKGIHHLKIMLWKLNCGVKLKNLKVRCISVPVLNLDIVKIDWACNPCTKTAAIRSNSNKQSSLETCKAQGAYKIELLLHIDISPWGVYDWLSFWYFLARASIHICVDLLWIFWFGFAFVFAFMLVCDLPRLCWIYCWRCCCQTCFPPHEESTLRWPTFQRYEKVDGFDFTNTKFEPEHCWW